MSMTARDFALKFSLPIIKQSLISFGILGLLISPSFAAYDTVLNPFSGKFDYVGLSTSSDINIVGTSGDVLKVSSDGVWYATADSVGVAGVGDCTEGACLDGSADGGTYLRLYDGDSNYAQLDVGDLSGNLTVNLPASIPASEQLMTMTSGGVMDYVGTVSSNDLTLSGAMTATSYTASGSGLSYLNQGLIVNEASGATADDLFRVEGDGDANLIYTDVANDRVGIGTSSPSYKLDVSGVINESTDATWT